MLLQNLYDKVLNSSTSEFDLIWRQEVFYTQTLFIISILQHKNLQSNLNTIKGRDNSEERARQDIQYFS